MIHRDIFDHGLKCRIMPGFVTCLSSSSKCSKWLHGKIQKQRKLILIRIGQWESRIGITTQICKNFSSWEEVSFIWETWLSSIGQINLVWVFSSLLCLIHVRVYYSIYSIRHGMSYNEITEVVIPVLLISGLIYFGLGAVSLELIPSSAC